MRRIVFFDIDHTLVSHVGGPHIPPATKEAVRLLKENGHVPAIATGRGAFLSRLVADELEIGLLVCANGAQIVSGGQTLSTAWFPDDALESFKEVARRYPELAAAVDEGFVYTHNRRFDFEEYFNRQAGYSCVRPMSEMRRAVMCYVMSPPPLSGEYGLFSSPPDGVMLEPMRYFVEARASGTSKWLGIKDAADRLGESVGSVVTFGDGPNDVEMLSNAPLSVAVASASEAVKKSASFVTGDIDDGGILSACRELGLIADS